MNKSKQSNSSVIYIIDTSAILSGKPLPIDQEICWTVEEISHEFSAGGSSFRMFQYLLEKGLSIHQPTASSKKRITEVIAKMGESLRLSNADQAVLALAVDVDGRKDKKAIILTDDYSIQNIASVLHIKFQTISQSGITKTFKWKRICKGCKRELNTEESDCRICGSDAHFVVDKKIKHQKKKNGDA